MAKGSRLAVVRIEWGRQSGKSFETLLAGSEDFWEWSNGNDWFDTEVFYTFVRPASVEVVRYS